MTCYKTKSCVYVYHIKNIIINFYYICIYIPMRASNCFFLELEETIKVCENSDSLNFLKI